MPLSRTTADERAHDLWGVEASSTWRNHRAPHPDGDYLTQRTESIVGTWGTGPLQNETAEDVLDSLVDMSLAERLATVGSLFRGAITGAEAGRLLVLPEEVIAGACVVAASRAGVTTMPWLQDHPEIQDWLADVPTGTVTDARHALAVAALENEHYWSSWVDDADRAEAREALDLLKAALS